MDKNKVMIDYLMNCPVVQENPLFFNFGKTKEDVNQFIATANNESMNTPYIDGSVLKIYNFILLTYKTISYNAIVKTGDFPDENLTEMAEFQEVIDWINEQEDLHNYPDFGEDCVVDSIKCSSTNPVWEGINTEGEQTVATYSITIQVDYLDNSKRIWK